MGNDTKQRELASIVRNLFSRKLPQGPRLLGFLFSRKNRPFPQTYSLPVKLELQAAAWLYVRWWWLWSQIRYARLCVCWYWQNVN